MEKLAEDRLKRMENIAPFAKEVAKSLGLDLFTASADVRRQGYYLLDRGLLPGVFRERGRCVGLKSKIREGLEEMARLRAAEGDDRLDGINDIAEFFGDTPQRIALLARQKLLPGVFQEGNRYFGLKSKIIEGYSRKASEPKGTEAA